MKIVLSRLNDEKPVIKLDGKLLNVEPFTREMEKKLTILDFIGLGVSVMFLLALSQSMQIEYDNLKDIDT